MGKHSAKTPTSEASSGAQGVQAPIPEVSTSHRASAGAASHYAHIGGEASGGTGGDGQANPDSPEQSRLNGPGDYIKRRKKRGHRHVLRVVLVTILAVIIACGAAVALYVHNINSAINKGVDNKLRNALVETDDPGDPFYMLLLGIDKDEERAESKDYGEDYSAYRTDTIILARIDPKNKKATLISIPRDTLVDMGDNGKQKINAAYSFGGAAYATQVVSKFAGVKISHYAEIDMDGFAEVVDTIGGVTVNLPVAVKDPHYTGLDLPAGKQTLDGKTAALLGRARHAYDSYGGGDFYRAANQRMLIGAVAQKVLSSDAATMVSTISTLAGYVTTDMNVSSIARLATNFVGMDINKDIYSGQCPTVSQYIDDTWYEICDTSTWRQIMRRVDKGLPPYTDASQDFTAGVAGSVGVSASSDGSDSSTSDGSSSQADAEYSGSVLVLNGTTTAGVAASAASTLQSAGFTTSTNDAPQVLNSTTVYYNGDAEAKARGVADTLGLDATPVANDGSWDTSSDVVVVFGLDWTNGQTAEAASNAVNSLNSGN